MTAGRDVGRFGARAERDRDRTYPHPGMLMVQQRLHVLPDPGAMPVELELHDQGAPRFWARRDSTAQSGYDVAKGEKCSCTSFHPSPELMMNTMVACCLSSAGEPFIMPVKLAVESCDPDIAEYVDGQLAHVHLRAFQHAEHCPLACQ